MSLIVMTGGQSPLGLSLRDKLTEAGHEVLSMTAKAYVHPESLWMGVTGIVHLGGSWNPRFAAGRGLSAIDSGVCQTLEVVRAAYRHSHWILYASTTEIYGETFEEAADERREPRPLNLFGRIKVLGEEMIARAAADGLRTAILRMGHVYGSADDWEYDPYVAPFAWAAVRGDREVTVRGVSDLRDYVWWAEAAEAFAKTVAVLEAGDDKLPPLNISSGVPVSTGTIASLASFEAGRLGKSVQFAFDARHAYEPVRLVCSIERAKHHLGWRPEVAFATGFRWLVGDLVKFDLAEESRRKQAALVAEREMRELAADIEENEAAPVSSEERE